MSETILDQVRREHGLPPRVILTSEQQQIEGWKEECAGLEAAMDHIKHILEDEAMPLEEKLARVGEIVGIPL